MFSFASLMNKICSFPVILFWMVILASCSTTTTESFDSVKQAKTDDEALQAWFKARNLTDSVTKTASGLYFRITKTNSVSPKIVNGNKVYVRYEGRLLNDTLFDNNLLTSSAFRFIPGNGSVIRAWEEGILKFGKDEEGYIYAPSGLGYGNNAQRKIPPNSCLRFFIRVTNVE